MELEEVPFRPSRHAAFTEDQRWALLLEYDQCLERGSKSAFCRRVGVSSFTMSKWTRLRAAGILTDPALTAPNTNPRRALAYDERQELERLKRENARLKRDLEQSRAAAEILGKAAALLEELAKSADQPPAPQPPPVPGRPAWLSDPDSSTLPSIPPRHSTASE